LQDLVSVEGAHLVVRRAPIVLRDGKLALDPPVPVRVLRQLDGRGFADAAQPGSVVAIHWNWVCQELAPAALARLRHETAHALALANQTM